MKLLATTIRPRDWPAVRAALAQLAVHDISVTTVQVLGPGNGRAPLHAGAEYIVDRVPQARIEMAVDDHLVERAIAAIGRCSSATIVHCLAIAL